MPYIFGYERSVSACAFVILLTDDCSGAIVSMAIESCSSTPSNSTCKCSPISALDVLNCRSTESAYPCNWYFSIILESSITNGRSLGWEGQWTVKYQIYMPLYCFILNKLKCSSRFRGANFTYQLELWRRAREVARDYSIYYVGLFPRKHLAIPLTLWCQFFWSDCTLAARHWHVIVLSHFSDLHWSWFRDCLTICNTMSF